MRILGLTPGEWGESGLWLFLFVVAAAAGRWLINLIFSRVGSRLVRYTSTKLDDVILEAIRMPLYYWLLLMILKAALASLGFIPFQWSQSLGNLFGMLDLCVGVWLALRVVNSLFIWYGEEVAVKTETRLDEQLLPFFRRLVLVVLTLVGLIMLFGRYVDVSGLVTTLGVGSLAIALAAQAALEDTISGLIIMIDSPFRIGDRIEVQDLDTWGDVVDVSLRSTRIRTRDNRMVIVPNSVMSKSLVVNHSYPNRQYRIQVHIGVAYGTELEHARGVMVEAVKGCDGIVPDKPVEALFLEFGDSVLVFRVRWWIDSYVDTRRMFDQVNSALYEALNEAGVDLPYPQLVVHQSSVS